MRKKVIIIATILVVCVALFLYKDTIMSLVSSGTSSSDFSNLDSVQNVDTNPQDIAPIQNSTQALPSGDCDANNANICLENAKKYIDAKDLVKALGLLIQGCEYQDAQSCLILANMYNNNDVIPKSEYLYFGYLSKACSLNNMAGCYDLGVKYYRGDEIVKRDTKKSFELFKKVCDSGDVKGCNNLAVIYNNGDGGIKKDLKLAKDLFDKACKSGYEPSCSNIQKAFK
ncbi:tetratricopeptide repeat protein [Helicobacter sp. MIT 99-5507]|uniref:tetratricopeptide repeat protein n=1 Tax=Helicobacter sp. MIT 99-5507 TaxID=152489 RepID=UPI000E1EA663|nr:tetratricopeptide repeat protein [Helicobacter sp. MIT 99-5507]RDU57341.1 hypothetical protein CQA42_05210 [Helicobacter sp. MIT 99-5507]